jgi:ribosome biogenesis protein Nip4
MVFEFIKQFTEEEIAEKDEKIIKVGDSYYLVKDELLEVMNGIGEECQHIGTYLGEDEKPSLALLEMLAKKSRRKIFVDEKGGFLFICGRDLMGGSIKEWVVNEGLVLVQNMKDENLGYGKVVGNFGNKDSIVVKNLLDRGHFLRREMHK